MFDNNDGEDCGEDCGELVSALVGFGRALAGADAGDLDADDLLVLARAQHEIVELAADRSFEAWRAQVRMLTVLADQDGKEPEDPGINRAWCTPGLAGTYELRATFDRQLGWACP